MGERHSIVVRVVGGRVDSVAFCECCPAVMVEVRSYESTSEKYEEEGWPRALGDGRWRDGMGVYRAEYHESGEGGEDETVMG